MGKISKWLFKTFGETNSFLWIYGIFFTLNLIFWAAVIYAVAHFVIKYW